ncbi:MAG: type I glutamate--ammonia ligase [Deltaproteobacteria bacterium]|nr:type I glutamate--ammonia ligase [Deltaproteobacteria bacterium]MBW2069934.1 type I glutamate--ammonia ligase [Deltaproteobacteria bacterium]
MDVQSAAQQIAKDEIQFIAFQFTTIDGVIRQVIHPARRLEALLSEGIGFDGSSCKYVPVNESDLCLKPDLTTYRVLPWGEKENKTARFICDVYTADGEQPFPSDPRSWLKKMVGKMKREFGPGWDLLLAPEIEFFLLEKDEKGAYLPHDRGSYFDIPPYDKSAEFRKDLSRALDSVGIVCEKSHHEVPNGKSEINFAHADALATADNTITYRQVVKYFAAEKGLIATFMAKPFVWTYGCGMHVHLNLRDSQSGVNLFYDQDKENYLSDTALHFIAGLLVHAGALTAITNPTVNSYKRLVPGWEAPVYVCWGFNNRSSLLRIPASSPGARRIESRNPDSSCNPYLAFGAILVAGLDGISRKLTPPPYINDNVYAMTAQERKEKDIAELPENLKEALQALQADEVLCSALGEKLLQQFVALKEKEWKEFATAIHPWELEKYLNV